MKNEIIILAGPGGSGKTTIAQILQDKFGFYWLDGDEMDTEFFPNGEQWEDDNLDKIDLAHDKIIAKAKELFDQGKNVVVDYIIFKHFESYFDKFKKVFGKNLRIKILLPPVEEIILRDKQRECWTTGQENIRSIAKQLGKLKGTLGEECFIDSSKETAEETVLKHFVD